MTLRGGLHWDSGDFFFFRAGKNRVFLGTLGTLFFSEPEKKLSFFRDSKNL